MKTLEIIVYVILCQSLCVLITCAEVVLPIASSPSTTTTLHCLSRFRLQGDKCVKCPLCKRGYGYPNGCGNGDGIGDSCVTCKEGYDFNDDPKRNMKCKQCRKCEDLHREMKFKCRIEANAECDKCLPGYYNLHEHQGKKAFEMPCSRCLPETNHIDCQNWRQKSTAVTAIINDKPMNNGKYWKQSPSWQDVKTPITGVGCFILGGFVCLSIVFIKRRHDGWKASSTSVCSSISKQDHEETRILLEQVTSSELAENVSGPEGINVVTYVKREPIVSEQPACFPIANNSTKVSDPREHEDAEGAGLESNIPPGNNVDNGQNKNVGSKSMPHSGDNSSMSVSDESIEINKDEFPGNLAKAGDYRERSMQFINQGAVQNVSSGYPSETYSETSTILLSDRHQNNLGTNPHSMQDQNSTDVKQPFTPAASMTRPATPQTARVVSPTMPTFGRTSPMNIQQPACRQNGVLDAENQAHINANCMKEELQENYKQALIRSKNHYVDKIPTDVREELLKLLRPTRDLVSDQNFIKIGEDFGIDRKILMQSEPDHFFELLSRQKATIPALLAKMYHRHRHDAVNVLAIWVLDKIAPGIPVIETQSPGEGSTALQPSEENGNPPAQASPD